MLSRVADNLYWMSRYLERAEHTARLLDVNLHAVLDGTSSLAEHRWERLQTSLGLAPVGTHGRDAYRITESLTVDVSNPASIVSCIAEARDNARQAWEQIDSEMWEQINRLYLDVSRRSIDEIWTGEPHAFLSSVKEGAHLFQGTTDATMSHAEGWQFIRVARGLERARATATLIDAHCIPGELTDSASLSYLEWVGLLKSCTAFEAYVKIYSADVDPRNIAAFLLLNAEFPRSVRFLAAGIRSGLQAIGKGAGGRRSGRPERLAGRLQASLDYAHIDEIMMEGLHEYLDGIRLQCEGLHTAIYQTFIRYPVAPALSA